MRRSSDNDNEKSIESGADAGADAATSPDKHSQDTELSDTASSRSSISTTEAADFSEQDVRDITDTVDDRSECANTLRMWVLTLAISTVVTGVDALFQLRYPTVTVGSLVAVLVTWPVGLAWARWLPTHRVLNPGPFSRKEHACILMFTNITITTALTNKLAAEQIHFFGIDVGVGRVIYMNLICYLLSWGWQGLAEDILVRPAHVRWPGVLGQVALITTLHRPQPHGDALEKQRAQGWSLRMAPLTLFAIVFGASFLWYWITDLVFPALAYLGAFISWAAPNNATLSQVFGIQSGLGLMPLTLDWSQISNLSNPLLVPFWAACCLFGSFVFWAWIVLPALYYTNKWQSAHFPIMTNGLFNANGTRYDLSKVVDGQWRLVEERYRAYSPLYLPAAFVLNAALGVASFVALILTCALNFRQDIWTPIRQRHAHRDVHNVLLDRHPRLSKWFYVASTLVGLAIGIVYCEVWRTEMQISAGAFVVSLVLCAAFFLPLALVEARAGFIMTLDQFLEMISAFWLKGQPVACMYFTVFGYGTLQHALHMAQSAKIGHYLKVPPRLSAVVLFVAGVWSSLVNAAVTYWALKHTPNVCTAAAENNFTCRAAQTTFNVHVTWGLLGSKLFAAGGRYEAIYYFTIAAVVICVGVALMQRRYPHSAWKLVNPVLLIASGTKIPLNKGINFSAWFLVAFVFGYLIHKKKTTWWRRYNMVTAVGLDCGVAIAVIIIYFAITYTGASKGFSWWGNTVHNSGCDSKGCPRLVGPIPATPGAAW
ncbi:unnamed protein product [Parajaminaea phylloscopi]